MRRGQICRPDLAARPRRVDEVGLVPHRPATLRQVFSIDISHRALIACWRLGDLTPEVFIAVSQGIEPSLVRTTQQRSLVSLAGFRPNAGRDPEPLQMRGTWLVSTENHPSLKAQT